MWESIVVPLIQGWRQFFNPTPSPDEIWQINGYGEVKVIKIFPPLHAFQGMEYAISFVPTSNPNSIPEYWDLQSFRQRGYRVKKAS